MYRTLQLWVELGVLFQTLVLEGILGQEEWNAGQPNEIKPDNAFTVNCSGLYTLLTSVNCIHCSHLQILYTAHICKLYTLLTSANCIHCTVEMCKLYTPLICAN